MSEDLINLEEDGPDIDAWKAEDATEKTAEAAAAVTEPPPAPAEDQPAEVEAVEVAGKKYVPISAVISERKQRQALAERAARADALEQEVADLRPYAKFLKDNPTLLQPRQPEPSPVRDVPTVDPEAEEMARLLDLYTPEGQPDIKRATKFLKVVDAKTAKQTQSAMAPVQERGFQEQSARNFYLATQFKDPQGRSPSQLALQQIWGTVTAEQSADPHVASILTATALGLDYATAKPQPAAPPPPLVTESAGGAPRRAVLSDIEQKVAKDRGVSATTWADSIKGFQPGRANQLED